MAAAHAVLARKICFNYNCNMEVKISSEGFSPKNENCSCVQLSQTCPCYTYIHEVTWYPASSSTLLIHCQAAIPLSPAVVTLCTDVKPVHTSVRLYQENVKGCQQGTQVAKADNSTLTLSCVAHCSLLLSKRTPICHTTVILSSLCHIL